MANPQHIKWLLEGVDAWNARRERDDFVPDFEGADIYEAFHPSIKNHELYGIYLRKINFRFADLRGANFKCADMQGADLRQSDLEQARMHEANFRHVDFSGANLQGVSMKGSKLIQANLTDMHIQGADLSRCNLYRANLSGANLTDVNFQSSDLRHANIQRALLQRTVLANADLRGAITHEANFRDADLRQSRLQSSYNYAGNWVVSETNLQFALNIKQRQLNSAIGDGDTTIPEHLERPARWLSPSDIATKPNENNSFSDILETGPTPHTPSKETTNFENHVQFLIKTAPAVAVTATTLSHQINAATNEFRNSGVNRIPDEVLRFEEIATTFEHFGTLLKKSQRRAKRNAQNKPDTVALEAEAAALKSEIEHLVEIIGALTAKGRPDKRNAILHGFLTGVGSTAGVALLAGLTTYLGPYGQEAILTTYDYLSDYIKPTAPPPPPPSVSV